MKWNELEKRVTNLLDTAKFSTAGDRRVARMLLHIIAKEQDKITRHAILNEVDKIRPAVVFRGSVGLLYDDVYSKIINTQDK
jgi:hypothetical protein